MHSICLTPTDKPAKAFATAIEAVGDVVKEQSEDDVLVQQQQDIDDNGYDFEDANAITSTRNNNYNNDDDDNEIGSIGIIVDIAFLYTSCVCCSLCKYKVELSDAVITPLNLIPLIKKTVT